MTTQLARGAGAFLLDPFLADLPHHPAPAPDNFDAAQFDELSLDQLSAREAGFDNVIDDALGDPAWAEVSRR